MQHISSSRMCRLVVFAILLSLLTLTPLAAQTVLFSTTGSFAPGDQVGSDGAFEDSYEVRVEGGTTVEVIIRSEEVDTYIDATLPDGTRVTNDDYEGYNAGFLRVMPVSGTLRFTASPLFSGDRGPYSVIVSTVGPPEELQIGQTINGSFGKADVGGGATSARYTIRGRSGQRVVIELDSNDFDAYLEAVDESGREFYDDDGGDTGFNSRLAYEFVADGTLIVTASSLGGSSTGSYELRVYESSQDIAARYDGQLDAGDRRTYDGKYVDQYEYAGTRGQQVSILLESDDFDTVLFVSNPDGSNLGRDDDSGGNGNSMLNVTLPADGTYTISVVPFFSGTGSYSLTIYE